MVRSPSVDKNGTKKGAWSEEEDDKLRAYVLRYGHWNWRRLPKFAALSRCGKSCRFRWMNYLRPGVKRGNYTAEEEEIILKLHGEFGNKWSMIASKLPGRTDNDIKNHWHTHLRRSKNQDSNSTKSTDHQETSERSHRMDDSDYNKISSSMSTFDSNGNGDQMGTDNIAAVDFAYSQDSSLSYDSTLLNGDIIGGWTAEEDTSLSNDSTLLDGALRCWTLEDSTNSVEPIVEPFDDESFWTQPFTVDTSNNNNILQLQMPQFEEEILCPFSPYLDKTDNDDWLPELLPKQKK